MVRQKGTHTVYWGRASNSPALGTLEHTVRINSKGPGPGEYDVRKSPSRPGSKLGWWGGNAPKSTLDEVRR